MTKTTIYIPDEVQAAIKGMAHREGRSQSELIREALSQYVEAHPRPQPKSIGIASNASVSGRDVKELREEWARDRLGGEPEQGER